MKKLKVVVSCLVAGVLVACASFNAQVFNTERLAVDTVSGAYGAYNSWYHQRTNSLGKTDANLESQRDYLNTQKQNVGRVVKLVENARVKYKNDSSSTNKIELDILLKILGEQSSNIVSVVQMVIKN